MIPEQKARNQRCEAILARMEGWGGQYRGKGSVIFQGSLNSALELAQKVRESAFGRMSQTQNQINFTAQDEKDLTIAQSSFRNAVDSAVNFPQGKADKDMVTQLKGSVQELNALRGKDKQVPITTKESPLSRLMQTMKAKIGPNTQNGPSSPPRNN